MANKSPGRMRPVNSGLPHVLPEVIERLARATRWQGEVSQFIGTNGIIPGAATNRWCTSDPDGFSVDYLWSSILSKYDDGKPSSEKETRTWERFKEAEAMCGATNKRLLFDRTLLQYSEGNRDVYAIIEMARRKISRALGRFCWNRAAEGFKFTTGASTRVPRRQADTAYKYSGIPETTIGNLDLATTAIRMVPLWEERLRLQGDAGLCNISPGNKIITVAKNYKTNRPIAIEPDMNMYVQKGIARLIRNSLVKVGIDIRSQAMNQDLAHYASVTDSLATIDMSMASDTVSLEVVRLLLPPKWVEALEQCRSPIGVLPSGEKLLYRKFSSMGNGYTFELETLIFWGLSAAVCSLYGVSERLLAVYGDDVIVPSSVASKLIEVLNFCGFKTNEDKTFIKGPFRESCGKHYLSGQDVTPFYIKAEPKVLTDLFLLHNQIYRWCLRNQWNRQWDRVEMRSLLSWLRSQAPSNWRRPRLPDGRGDGAFIGTFDEARPKLACTYRPGNARPGKRDRWEGYIVKVLVEVVSTADFFEEGYGSFRKRKDSKPEFFEVESPPEIVGRLLKSIIPTIPEPLDFMRESLEGALPLSARVREVTTLVPQFATLDPFLI